MENATALIIDDEPDIRELLEITLSRMGLNTHTAATLKQARQQLANHFFDLCLTDMRLPDGNGIELVEHVQQYHPNLPIAVITAHGNMESAVEALKKGAFDFVSKPVDLSVLRSLVTTALQLNSADNIAFASSHQERPRVLIGNSAPMQELRTTISKLARNQAPVYISGESGTGKELAARLIHENGPRAQHPFVPVNCGAIPSELMESEFFGHLKGSFSGAIQNKDGLFQAARGGTLFLDEVAELPLNMQVKLLRAIQEKAIRPVGSAKEESVDVRILTASHKNLLEEVEAGHFRQDLYYRIHVIELKVPTLRERREDVPALCQFIFDRIALHYGFDNPRLSEAALQRLANYSFPGNIRELENILERALALADDELIEPADLLLPSESNPTATCASVAELEDDEIESDDQTLDHLMNQQERDALIQALDKNRWKKSDAASSLGISYRQLRYRMKKLNIE